jgi:predicted RNA-binding protein with PUA-like domain
VKYWIIKTEPETYSFDDLVKDKKTVWDGVRNYQARNNLRGMSAGDFAVVYESVGPKTVVGLAKVIKTAYQDPKTKDDWSAVDIAPVKKFAKLLTLAEMKSDSILKNMSLVKNSRLSVCPVTKVEFDRLLKLSDP